MANNLKLSEPTSWITVNPGSYYQEACFRKGYCKPTQYLVVDFQKWLNWYSNDEPESKVPYPAFVSDTYVTALSVANELNQPVENEGIYNG